MTPKLPRTSLRALFLVLVTLVATACPGPGTYQPNRPNPNPNAPLAQLGGELKAAGSGAASGPIRLALAWYPGLMSGDGQPLSQPGAIATQDIAYDGALPLEYGFDVADAPPAEALRPMPDGFDGQAAIGVLLAYQDGNGNGRLDTIAAEGAPVDHVVGASFDWAAAPAYLLVYLTAEQPASSGLTAGFNLLELSDAETTEVVGLDTAIPITISQGGPLLDLFVCEAAWDGSNTQAPCGLKLGEDPQEPEETVLNAQVEGSISASTDAAEAAFKLVEVIDGQPRRVIDATVTLDGVGVPFDSDSGLYYAPALEPSRFAQERTVELVATRGNAVLRRTIAIPAFDLTSVPAKVMTGTDFDIAWSAPSAAESFDLALSSDDTVFLQLGGLEAASYHVNGVSHVGLAQLTVTAKSTGETSVTVTRTATIQFEDDQTPPIEEGLQVGGIVSRWNGGVMTSLFVTANGEEVSVAYVMLNGLTQLSYNWATHSYELLETEGSSIFDGGPVSLDVVFGDITIHRELVSPPVPNVLTPAAGATVAQDQAFTATWEDAQAGRYDLALEVPYSTQPISVASTTGLSATLGAYGLGPATLWVTAVNTVSGSNPELGVIELVSTAEVPLTIAK